MELLHIQFLTIIANCNINIAVWDTNSGAWPVKLGEKIRYLREVEGSLRGLGRPMTQLELVRALREELGKGRGSTRGTGKAASISQ